jgi:ABC-type antimicrobial peptide transport system permease subunit
MHSLLQEPESFARSLPYTPTNFAHDYGFSSLTVYITEYNITTAWYDPFPRVDDVLIHVSIPISYQVPIAQIQFYGTMAQGELIGAGAIGASDVIGAAGTIYMHIFMKPDKDGKAILHGVKPYTRGLVEAYVLNQTTGNIEYAPDHGTYAFKDPFIPAGENVPVGGYYIYKKDTLKTITLFKCGSIALLNVVNPITLVYEGTVEALNFLSHGAHIWHGGVSILPEAILFVPADTKTEIIVRSTQMKSALAGFYYPYVVLANASSEYPWGYGYTVKSGEVLILANPVMIWEQLHRMNWNRIQASITYHVYNELVDNYSKLSLKEYDLAQEALSNKLYSSCFGHIMTAWSYEYACYNSMVDLTVDIVTTTAYSLLILIPFILFFERLFFDMQSGRGRIACLLASLVVFILFLYAFHPGPHLATNLPMILMGFGVVLILIPVLVFSFGEAQLTISEMQRMSVGSHFVSISRASAFIMALSMGIQQMRRRKIRTVLTLTSIIATVLILVVFTSIAFTIIIYEVKSERRPVSYDGFMVHRMPWAPVTEHFLLTIENKYGREVKVCPRGWVYPPMQHLGLVGQEHALSAFVAVSPEEENVTELPRTLIDGRWFTSDDCKVIIIGKSVAEKYKVNIGSNVNIWGLNFTVIGIFSEEAYSRILDLDMAPITPLDYVLGIETGMAGIFDARLSPETIALIPFKFAQETWNILPMTISVKFSTAELSLKEASELSKIVPYDVYAGIKEDGNIGTLAIFRARAGVNPIGVEYAFIPFFISGFIILNTMLGAVYERTREVGILGSIGLAPLHIIGTFLAESLAYAVIGGVLGYFIGIISIGILDFLKAIPPGLTPNFAASFVMVAVSFSMLMAIVSTIYPAYKAGTMVTPYTERKFKIGTKPKGGVWDIPFPFVATEGEIDGLMVFFKEYYDAHSAPGTAIFVAKSTEYREFEQETGLQKVLMTTLWLKPFDLGVYETTRLIATRAKGSMTYTLTLSAKHESGLEQTWINCHRAFVKELRKQFLIWRALKPEEKHNYIKRSKTELKRLES